MTSALALRPINAQQPITTVEDLRAHLYHAAQLELSTIPLYLYAAYSIQTQSYSQWAPSVSAFRSIRSVVIEEMLHLSLARNLMIAVGGADEIRFYDEDFVPTYPSPMLHRIPTLMLSLEPCSETLMRDIFMPLELPARTDAPPQPNEYHTIGQFYAAIKQGFETLDGPELWQGNQPALQYASTYWNQDGGGSPIVVCDLQTALDAIKTIVEQGEGIDPHRAIVPLDPVKPQPGLSELSHYAKFRRIAEGIDQIGTVWPVRVNPRAADYPSPARELAEFFNAAYSYLLYMLDALFASSRQTIVPGQQSPRYGIERTFVGAMNGLVFPIADLLARQPLGDGTNAAPTFEYYQFDMAQPLPQQLGAMCDALLGQYPSLGGDNGVRAMISLLPQV